MAIKKAQLFSMIAIMMSLFFILLFSGLTRVTLDHKVDQIESEVLSLNDIVLDFETLIEGSAESSSLQILNFSVDYLDGTNYFSNFTAFFDSCFENGTFYDEYTFSTKWCSSYGENVSFIKHLEDVFSLTGSVYNLDISIMNVAHSMVLADAYSLQVNASMLLDIKLISSKKHIAWNRKLSISQQVDFNGITDPASIGTDFLRKIRYAPDERTFTRTGFNGDFSTVKNYVDGTYYFLDSTGPSFFERMQGNQTNTFNLVDSRDFGIATFIPRFNQSGDSLYLANVSMVDHHYDWGATPFDGYLRLFNSSSSIDGNLTFYYTYLIQGMGFNESQLELAQGNCDDLGCDWP